MDAAASSPPSDPDGPPPWDPDGPPPWDPQALDRLAAEDPVIRNLLRTMRDGAGCRLDAAVDELRQLGVDDERLANAARRVREQMTAIMTVREPRTIAPGGKESWYPGPRAEDPNWGALLDLLRESGWEDEPISQLDTASTKIVAHLPDPHSPIDFHCVGLVLGYVQSGKTTNFTAVLAKAADAGYRGFIVLSGVHNGLRQQTQDRLNEQLWQRNSTRWHRLTDEDDFRPTANVDALLDSGQSVLAVVKKNGPRLRALKRWLFGARPDVLARCPVLIIDDEADQASVNTAKPDRIPRVINRLIREIVGGLPRAAYVGYTATPFANVLIDPANYEDLYPRDFIIDLPRPRLYIGPEAIFGREPLEFDPDGDLEPGHSFVRTVPEDELDDLRPKGAAARASFGPSVTPSLLEAIHYFLLSTGARRCRGMGNRHATALLHTSQYRTVHHDLAGVVRGELHDIRCRLAGSDPDLLEVLHSMWQRECAQVPAEGFGFRRVQWEELSPQLPAVAADVEVIVDNSTSLDRLHYPTDRGRVVIAVGGNTLSRGLTLEGLSVSFFVRSASAYDTLLQMGRWFGYRHGYADLTRIWMTDEMREWFHHLATVEQEIRADIARYESDHLTPLNVAPRIRTHPKLAITAAAKMQAAVDADVSYSGRRLQTILFNHSDRRWLEDNLAATRALVRRVADAPRLAAPGSGKEGVSIIGPVPSEEVLRFLSAYRFHENSRDLNSEALTKYIAERRAAGELTHFRIAIMGRHPARAALGTIDVGLEEPVPAINRARLNGIGGRTYADIKALMSMSDRVVDLPVSDDELRQMEAGAIARLRNRFDEGGRGDGTALLAIYPISRHSQPTRDAATRQPLDAVADVIGVGLVFPVSESAPPVGYKTADLSPLVAVEAPDESDEVVEAEIPAMAGA